MLYIADAKISFGKRISSFECSISGTPGFKFKEEIAGVTRNRLAIIAVVSVLAHTPPHSTIYLKINSKHVFEHFAKNPACKYRTNLDMWCVVDKLCLYRQVICESTCKTREEISGRISKIMSFEVPSDTRDEIMPAAEYAYKHKVSIACANDIQAFFASGKSLEDYRRLRTYGKDKYSRLKAENLPDYEKIAMLADNLSEKQIAAAARWHARGLSITDSVRKVMADRYLEWPVKSAKLS